MSQPATQNAKTVELTELVKTLLFKQVSMAQVGPLLKFCPVLEMVRGDTLIVPGQMVDKVHVLLQGRLQVFSGAATDKPVAEIQPGECVGLSSFVDRQPCHVTIVSAGNCRLLAIDEQRMAALVNTPTLFSRNLLFMLMKYMRDKAAREAAAATVATSPAAPTNPANVVDDVTGLHNQRWMDETLDRLILRAANDRQRLSIVAVDLLQPAELLAEYGQEMLDLALREIAGTVRAAIRPTDLIARHSTGRFILMLPDTDQDGASLVAGRIEHEVNSGNVVIPDGCVLPPMRIVTGGVMMKAFVAGRKLVADAMAAMEQNRLVQVANLKALAEVQAATLAADSAPAVPSESELNVAESDGAAMSAPDLTQSEEMTVKEMDPTGTEFATSMDNSLLAANSNLVADPSAGEEVAPSAAESTLSGIDADAPLTQDPPSQAA